MAPWRSPGARGALNPSSCSGGEPSDVRMPKTIQFWCLNPKTSCPVLWKMNFSQRNWIKGVCASGYSWQENNQSLCLRLEKVFYNGLWELGHLQGSWVSCSRCQGTSRAATLCWECIKMQVPAGLDACGVNGPGREQWDLLSRGVLCWDISALAWVCWLI